MNLRLFRRDNHGLTLTPAGELIYREAKAMIRRTNKVLAQAHTLETQEETVIRVGSSLMRPGRVVVELWQQVQADCPGLKLKVVPFEDRRESYLRIIAGLGNEIDMVFSTYPPNHHNGQCSVLHLGMAPLCIAVPTGKLLTSRRILNLEDLHGERLQILKRYGAGPIDTLRDLLLAEHPQVELVDVPDYDMDVFHRCEETGDLLLTVEMWQDIHPSLVTVPVDWEFAVPYGLLYSKHPTKAVEQFVETIRANKAID